MYRIVDFGRYCWQCRNFSLPECDEPCNDCLAHPMNDDSRRPIHYDEAERHAKLPYDKIEFIRPYTYEAEYSTLDYKFAKAYYENLSEIPQIGECSAFRKGQFVGRNLDWTYDETPEYIVRTPAKDGRHAVLGIASGFKNLDDGSQPDELYKVLPFQLYDGINDSGLSVSILVVPTDYGTKPSHPLVQQKEQINGLMLSRFMLDKFATAKEAVEYVRDYVSVYFSSKYIRDYHYLLHYFVADEANTYCLEIINGYVEIMDLRPRPYVTNFNVYGIIRNADGSVLTPATLNDVYDPVKTNKITEHGSGLERYNLINSKWPRIGSKEGVISLLKELWYSRAYITNPNHSDPYWYTEFVSDHIWCNNYARDFELAVREAGALYAERDRFTGLTWHTVHTVVYDMAKKEMTVFFQEENVSRVYKV